MMNLALFTVLGTELLTAVNAIRNADDREYHDRWVKTVEERRANGDHSDGEVSPFEPSWSEIRLDEILFGTSLRDGKWRWTCYVEGQAPGGEIPPKIVCGVGETQEEALKAAIEDAKHWIAEPQAA